MGKWDFDFVKNFEKHKEGLKNEEILERVRQVEKDFRSKQLISSMVCIAGVFLILLCPVASEFLFGGILCYLTGVITMIQNNIIVKVSLYHLYNYWISNNRFEAEIRKSEAADL